MEVSGGGSGEDQDAAEQHQHPRKKRYHRHTARQIQELEAMFKDCPHPDEKQRMQLSKDLGLEPRQVKFWFQNRRTQMKAQHERADNSVLRSENEKIRCENIAIREALKNVICPNCGGPSGDMSFDGQQQLRMENARLKEELDRLSSIAAKYIGRPIPPLGPLHPIPMPSVDLAVGGYGMHNAGPSTSSDHHIMAGHSFSDIVPSMPTSICAVTELEKSLIVELAMNAMEELVRMAQTDEPLWVKNVNENNKEVLSLEGYAKLFPRAAESKSYNVRREATRDSGLVIINGNALVDIFTDVNKWIDMFPTIVSKAKTVEVLASGMPGNKHGSLQLMYAELQVLSPLVSTREIYFLRYCQHHAEGLWAVVDVSVDNIKDMNMNQQTSSSLLRCRKLPSGCVIQDMPNGYSKVTWVEHVEPEDRGVHRMYRHLVNSGMAFGAGRWLANLQRMCERLASLMVTNISARELGVIPSPDGRRSMMKLAERMMSSFCANVSASTSHRWTTLSGSNEDGVRVTTRKSSDPGQPSGVVLCAATSLWLPISPHRVFDFFRDEQMRAEWDVLSSGNIVQEVAHIANGSHPGNCISLLRACNASQNNMLILQESCMDASGALVVYAPVDVSAINIAMSGEDPSYIALLPSGFAILPDGSESKGLNLLQASTSEVSRSGFDLGIRNTNNIAGGSLITVAFQILVSNLPSAKLNLESVTTVNNLICNTVQQIKAALHCSDA